MSVRRRSSPFIAWGVALLVLTSCGAKPCGLDRMTKLIHDEIRNDDRTPTEYVMVPPRREGALVYVAMAEKINVFYRRHYWIDPKRCRIAKRIFDQ
jgi:hypothetical protein